MTIPPRPKILGIGYPKFAIEEFNELAKKYEIHYFHPDDRAQVISEVKRLSEQHGPFDASWVVSGSEQQSDYAHRSSTTPLDMRRLTPRCWPRCSRLSDVESSPKAELVRVSRPQTAASAHVRCRHDRL